MVDSVISQQRGAHSEKPAEFRKIIERLYDGPYLELFGRDQVDGWTVYGNDPALLGEKKQPKEKKAPKSKKAKKGKKGEIQDVTGEEIAPIVEDSEIVTEDQESADAMLSALAVESPDATIITDARDLTPEQAQRIVSELASAGAIELCKKHRKEPKPCMKCKAEKQAKKIKK